MNKLTRADLLPLEAYAQRRADMRAEILARKKARQVAIGGNVTLIFEDRHTVQYQIQEMLRAERIFEPEGIQCELDAYNPLIPDGDNWKATMLLEYPDPAVRARELALLRGVEDCVWMRAGTLPRLTAIADEDLDRSNETKTSAVHFLRFQFPPQVLEAIRSGAPVGFGIDHDHFRAACDPVPEAIRAALAADLD
ncbi:MAG: DUF3501 family protein [Gammaproteobacteria bacterium]